MILITLKKRKKTSTQNNSYDIIPVLAGTEKLDRIGSYNQSLNLLTINVEALITLLWLGADFSTRFKQIFNNGSALLSSKKKIKIKY
jgi:hypothetical protein